jgi:hypothetical protein
VTSIRNIVRPRGIRTTPNLLKETLGASRLRSYPRASGKSIPSGFYDWSSDLFLVYPPPGLVANSTEEYHALHQFFSSNKPTQRGLLEQLSIPTIPCITRTDEAESLRARKFTEEETYIVRPLRHSGGRDYKVTINPGDFENHKEYCSVFFPKKREFRVIFLKGVPIITLRKRVPDGVDSRAPWNHATGSVFVTVEREENNHLLKTSCLDDLVKCSIIQTAHLVGVDILLDKGSKNYVVVELNSAPALTLEHNLEKVKQIVSGIPES